MIDTTSHILARAGENRSLRILMLCKYGRLGASSRLRMFHYISILQRNGLSISSLPLFPNAYVEKLYAAGAKQARLRAWKYYWDRISVLLHPSHSDIDWIQGELLPYAPRWIERALGRSVRPYVVDYDDALFHRYDLSSVPPIRWLLHDKIDKVMRQAACVVAGNQYLADRARSAGARCVTIIPTVVDAGRYAPVVHRSKENTIIGWIGSPVTERYLAPLRNVLLKLCAAHGARLLLVGASAKVESLLEGVPVERVSWSEDSEAASIARMDIGIMPLADSPWERGKCGYKLIQYMASGLPVVASPVGVNSEIVREGETGFLADGADAWSHALGALVDSVPLRTAMGQAGRKMVEDWYNLDVQGMRLMRVLRGVASGNLHDL